jgi:hypothetical protein
MKEGRGESVIARADVLQIADKDVQSGKHLRRGRQGRGRAAVETVHRKPGARIPTGTCRLHVLGLPAQAVLGAEQGHQVADSSQEIRGVDEA